MSNPELENSPENLSYIIDLLATGKPTGLYFVGVVLPHSSHNFVENAENGSSIDFTINERRNIRLRNVVLFRKHDTTQPVGFIISSHYDENLDVLKIFGYVTGRSLVGLTTIAEIFSGDCRGLSLSHLPYEELPEHLVKNKLLILNKLIYEVSIVTQPARDNCWIEFCVKENQLYNFMSKMATQVPTPTMQQTPAPSNATEVMNTTNPIQAGATNVPVPNQPKVLEPLHDFAKAAVADPQSLSKLHPDVKDQLLIAFATSCDQQEQDMQKLINGRIGEWRDSIMKVAPTTEVSNQLLEHQKKWMNNKTPAQLEDDGLLVKGLVQCANEWKNMALERQKETEALREQVRNGKFVTPKLNPSAPSGNLNDYALRVLNSHQSPYARYAPYQPTQPSQPAAVPASQPQYVPFSQTPVVAQPQQPIPQQPQYQQQYQPVPQYQTTQPVPQQQQPVAQPVPQPQFTPQQIAEVEAKYIVEAVQGLQKTGGPTRQLRELFQGGFVQPQ